MNRTKPSVLSVIFLFSCLVSFSQRTFFGEIKPVWENAKSLDVAKGSDVYAGSDLVILDEKTDFYFFSRKNEKIIKKVLIKINNDKGKTELENFRLPESFDHAWDASYFKQGRNAKIKLPFIYDFKVKSLVARKFNDKSWEDVPLDYKYETVKRVGYTGVFIKDESIVFNLMNLKAGEIVELWYELEFNSVYGDNLFYFHSRYPKLSCEYNFIYKVDKYLSEFSYILPLYLRDTISRSIHPADEKDYLIYSDRVVLKNLKPINYPANSCEGLNLPHVYLDFNFFRVLMGVYSTNEGKMFEVGYARSHNFEWLKLRDTNNYYTKVYDKQSATLRKFTATLPPLGTDSTHKDFFKALCDTFNAYKYYSLNQLYYNEQHLYEVSSGDHLLKRRLVGNHLWKLYRDILNENRVFYYQVNVQDRRYGEHSAYYRGHYAYEAELIAVPSGASYIYFMPRYNGMKYHLNELPFYFEGVVASLDPKNFQEDVKEKQNTFFKFIRTHKGTFNENSRTENATVKISTDSLKASVVCKESLSGQFSTVLRHLYLKDAIDSTIDASYFKKCTDKPGSKDVKIKLSSKITDFPFRYTFNCSENVQMKNSGSLDLKNWFSFPLSSITIPEKPTHAYFIDFDFSDTYNFMLDFNKEVLITNSDAFSKKISNEFFELESQIIKNSGNNYLLKVNLQVKNRKIPEEQLDLLMDLIKQLDEINNFSLKIDQG